MTIDPRNLRIADYSYELPDERIARYPLPQRDAARLLIYRDGRISEDIFRHLALHLPEGATLVLNTAKVVRARLHFRKPTGGVIEIFCLEPNSHYADICIAMASKGEVLWQCMVGGAAKWKEGQTLSLETERLTIYADLVSRNGSDFTIRFRWEPEEAAWGEVLEQSGQIPLPPYLNREAEAGDTQSYQTLFAKAEGSVAAPTASLHFTPGVLDSLEELGIGTAEVTLHVGAGTFKPVKSEIAGGHEMHGEWIEVRTATINALLTAKQVIASGTTSLRTLETLFWLGCRVSGNPDLSPEQLTLSQWEVYDMQPALDKTGALSALLAWMSRHELEKLIARTSILIAPGYQFRMADALITNFHQPNSTLLLLVAAFIGDDWTNVYEYALDNGFRFLSYGDASLLCRRS